MATNFTSLGVKNTLTVGGLATLASVIITTATITTLGVTTANITTANVQTLSGATIKNTNGSIVLDSTDLESTLTISGSTIRAVAGFTGSTLAVTPTSGSSALKLYGGAKGSHLCIRDSDGAGWTLCSALNGTLTCVLEANTAQCP